MIIDSLAKLGPHYMGRNFSAEQYIEIMEENGFDQAVIGPNRPLSGSFVEGNDWIEEVLERYPGRFYGAARIDPWQRENAIVELEKRFQSPKYKAIYLHPWEENYQCNRGVVLPIMDFARERNLPVIIAAGYLWVSHITQVGDLARQYPDVKIMVTNAGQLDLSGLTLGNVKYVLKGTPNLYMGTAAAVAAEWLTDLIGESAKGRVLFESGHPFFEADLERLRMDYCYINEDQKREIYEENIKSFLNL